MSFQASSFQPSSFELSELAQKVIENLARAQDEFKRGGNRDSLAFTMHYIREAERYLLILSSASNVGLRLGELAT
jgi:hypothetical protein